MCLRFRMYEDGRGWKYKVMSGIGPNRFKARYCKPDKPKSWKGLHCVPWRLTNVEAQKDLDAIAALKGWREC